MVIAAKEDSLSNQELTKHFFHSAKVSATLDDKQTNFWAVVYGKWVGIYRAWCVSLVLCFTQLDALSPQ
jgi:hypothetical protein